VQLGTRWTDRSGSYAAGRGNWRSRRCRRSVRIRPNRRGQHPGRSRRRAQDGSSRWPWRHRQRWRKKSPGVSSRRHDSVGRANAAVRRCRGGYQSAWSEKIEHVCDGRGATAYQSRQHDAEVEQAEARRMHDGAYTKSLRTGQGQLDGIANRPTRITDPLAPALLRVPSA
jgi:hypothetical protein